MNNYRQITTVQTAAVICSTIIGVGILSFPRYMSDGAGSSAPLAAFTGVILALVSFWLLAALCRKFPKESIFVFSRRLVGRPIACCFTILILIFFLLLTGITTRQFGDVVNTVLFRKTPIEATNILMLLLCLLSSRRDIVKFSYIHFFYLPLIVGPTVIITIISLKNLNLLNLQPLLTTPTPAFWEASLLASALFQSSFIITVLIPFMVKPRQAVRAGAIAILFSGGIYILIVIASVGMFGAEETKLLLYPTLETARSSAVGEGLLERLDAIFIIIWVISVFTTIYTTYYLAAYIMQILFAFKDQRMASTLLLPFMFITSMVPSNVFQTYSMTGILGICGIVLLTLYPLLLWIVYAIRRAGRRAAS